MDPRLRTLASFCLALAAVPILAGACDDGTGPSPNPAPTISSITPSSVDEGTADFALTVNGSDFVDASIVRWNGADRPTTYVGPTQVVAAIAAADVAQDGNIEITVFNPAPGGGTSNAVVLEISPQDNPEPSLAAIEPSTVEAGGTEATLTLTGTGFVPESMVLLGSTQKTPTYESPTELSVTLDAEDLADARTAVVKVVNPPPGGGTSNSRLLDVTAPVPTLASLSPTETTAGQDSFVVHVLGTDFIGNSVVLFEGSPRTTRWISSTELAVTLLPGDLAAAGEYTLTVVNPTPGGGTTDPATLTLVHPVPTLEELPSLGATAGGGGFELGVHGRNFVAGSVVRWNGADRPTTYLGPRRLSASISASDVAAAGDADVTVFNPTPGGGTSDAITMSIRTVGTPAVTDLTALDLAANDLVYDAGTDRLYASVPSTVDVLGNSVVAIDPATGTITDTVFVGSEPTSLALSDDGTALWVELDGTGEVRRIDLPSLALGTPFSLGGLRVEQMRVMPGQPATLAIALRNTCCSPRHEGVAIYDDGVRRALVTPGHTGSNTIVFGGSASVLYGFNDETTEAGFRTMTVGPDGVAVIDTTFYLIDGGYVRIEYAAGRVYASSGNVVDPLRRARVGEFEPTLSTTVLPDVTLGRAYFLEDGTLYAYDLNTFQSLGSVFIDTIAGEHPANSRVRLIRWAEDGLAFRDGASIYIFRTTLAAQ